MGLGSTCPRLAGFVFRALIFSTLLAALEMEAEDGSASREPLTPEPGDPAPPKKKKKKRAPPSGRCPSGSEPLRLRAPQLRPLTPDPKHLPDQDPENAHVANGNADQAEADGDHAATSKKTKRKR